MVRFILGLGLFFIVIFLIVNGYFLMRDMDKARRGELPEPKEDEDDDYDDDDHRNS